MKACRVCDESKPLDKFPRHSGRKDGHDNRCSACNQAAAKAWQQANPDKVREQTRRAKELNPGRAAEYQRAYYERHKDRARAATAKWKAENPDKIRRYAREKYWREADQQRAKARVKAAIARGCATGDGFAEYWQVLERDPCSYCGGPAGELDHVVPIALGGENSWENSTAACGGCNRSKNAKPMLLWMAGKAA